jgi:hypothetical protein
MDLNMQNANQKNAGKSDGTTRFPFLMVVLIVLGAAALHYRHENIGL